MPTRRIDWIDNAKGISILLFVLMQATFSYEALLQTHSWMHLIAAWAAPFAVPTLFLMAGLFLNRTLFSSKSAFFDRKVIRFVYFYAIWLAIQTLVLNAATLMTSPLSVLGIYAMAWVQPAAGLWLLPMLIVCSLVTWLLRFVYAPRLLIMAIILQIMQSAGLIHTGWILADRFAEYYAFFYAGYAGLSLIQRYADTITKGFDDVPAALLVWATINTVIVIQGTDKLPIISFVLGAAGAFAVIAAATLLTRRSWPWAQFVKYLGRNYLVIYLAYFMPLVLFQAAMAFTGFAAEPGLTILLLAGVSLGMPLALHQLLRKTPLKALYRRPAAFRLKDRESVRQGRLLTPPQTKTGEV
ncbi:acyltransferase family protein [Hyphomonas pacifica]|uniref:Acyltransferase 3 domain-containing protein n=1 Tax=Hyphomonas pacifica TaxID=1280941 RepID=A0A062TUN5_9PROT|nr:acyltransferase family protein [Hyphomonas pacifica]KCZ46166.1 hypothetical protein HY2_05655 [Hyphomonas pacifica]RAN31557.1 hypothetical protein HY11_07265 [Hyphomonas pacifica]RAN35768.1 hypothetical protein HY3_06630 [Hyphomonas pacifica]